MARAPTAALAAVILAIGGAGFWYWASAYFAVAGVHNAAVRSDTADLARRVDFVRVREDLKVQYSAALAEAMGARPGDSPWKILGAAIAGRILEVVIDATVTPAGIATLIELQRTGPREEVSGFHLMFAKKYTVLRDGASRFEVRAVADAQKKPALRFDREGLEWRLVGVRVPRDYLIERIRGRWAGLPGTPIQ